MGHVDERLAAAGVRKCNMQGVAGVTNLARWDQSEELVQLAFGEKGRQGRPHGCDTVKEGAVP
eukprot:7855674-Alexandrium_andersonii.AAC.1